MTAEGDKLLEGEIISKQTLMDDNCVAPVPVAAKHSPWAKMRPYQMLNRSNLGAYLQFIIIGIAVAFPTYAFFAAVTYFRKDVLGTSDNDISLEIVYLTSRLGGIIASVLFLRTCGFSKKLLGGFITLAGCLIVLPIIDQLHLCGETCSDAHIVLVYIVLVIAGMANAVVRSNAYALSSYSFPPVFTQGLMLGSGLGALFITLIEMLVKASGYKTRTASYYYFGVSSGLLLLATLVYFCVSHQSTYRHYSSLSTMHALHEVGDVRVRHRLQCCRFLADAFVTVRQPSVLNHCILLFLITTQDYMIVPEVFILAKDFIGNGWTFMVLLLVYNLSDIIGRGPLAATIPYSPKYAWIGLLFRFFFMVGISRCVPPHKFSDDGYAWILFIITMLLGMSTGHINSSIISYAPTVVTQVYRETVGYLCILSLFSGMAVGLALSLVVEKIINMT